MTYPTGIPLSADGSRTDRFREASVILGGGLSGLSACYALTRAGSKAVLFEADASVGGLSKTLRSGDFLYDIGGHRFFTKDAEIDDLVRNLMGDELVTVHRKSKIYLLRKFFDYPLRPSNAFFGLGMLNVFRIMAEYAYQKLKGMVTEENDLSLEDWVVRNFGRTMFNIYFKQYSEKVWGLDCSRISKGWVAKRIQGLSLGTALKNAFFRFSGKEIPSLVDTFVYPDLGIGRIADRFVEEISAGSEVVTSAPARRVLHREGRVEAVEVGDHGLVSGRHYISTIPLNVLVGMMEPEPPAAVLRAADSLGFRDLVLVAVTADRERVTDQTWIYIPERKYPFGRLHEPKNWSRRMAPEGKTLVVVEYFCFKGDSIWNSPDARLSEMTIDGLEELGFLEKPEVLGTEVIRVPKAYPLFEVGYEEHCKIIYDYLDRFDNLHIAGRSGTFQYQNMDHAIRSGLEVAARVLGSVPRA